MHFSNSSRLNICPFIDGSFPAEASARSSGENHLASWLLVGDKQPPLFTMLRFSTEKSIFVLKFLSNLLTVTHSHPDPWDGLASSAAGNSFAGETAESESSAVAVVELAAAAAP